MWIDIDLLDDRMISSVGVRDPVRSLEFKRDTSSEINVRFWLAGIQQELAAAAAGEMGIKPRNQYDGDLLVYAATWVKTGITTSTYYTFTPAFDGAALAALLGSGDADTENDQESITGMLEIKWVADGKTHRCQTVQAIIANDVIKDSEFSPTPLPLPIGDTVPVNGWTPVESDANWTGCASSDDGTKLVAVIYNGPIFTSVDSGTTWTERETSRQWTSCASSSDGTKLVATVASGRIFTSVNSGVTWTARDSTRNWQSCASSADGSKLVALNGNGQIFTSVDSGVTWTARESNRTWVDCASSADGTKLVATAFDGQIFTSADSGVTWTARETSRYWWGCASSADGTKLVATVVDGQIFTSVDSGVTWTARESERGWGRCASSADGNYLIALVTESGQIFTSANSGVTWVARTTTSRDWNDCASSADGSKLVALAKDGQIYLSSSYGVSTLAPPYIRVAGGFLYIQEADLWKKTALSTL